MRSREENNGLAASKMRSVPQVHVESRKVPLLQWQRAGSSSCQVFASGQVCEVPSGNEG